MVNKSYYLWAS